MTILVTLVIGGAGPGPGVTAEGVADPAIGWSRAIGSRGPVLVTDLALDRRGNVIVAGTFSHAALTPGPGAEALPNAGQSDVFVARYAPSGNLQWARRFGGAEADAVHDLAVDGREHVFLAGHFLGAFAVGGGKQESHDLTSAGGADAFLIELDAQGDVEGAWSWGGKWAETARAVATDSSGNLYVAGSFELAVDFDPGPGQNVLTSAGRKDAFLLKLDRERRLVWALQLGGEGNDVAQRLAVDGEGDVVAGGVFEGEARIFGAAAGPTLRATPDADLFLVKVSPEGEPRWARRVGGKGVERLAGLGVDRRGRVLAAGSFQGTIECGGGVLLDSAGSHDSFLARWGSGGELEWAGRVGGAQIDLAQGLAVAPGGEALLVGYFQGSADVDPGSGERWLRPSAEGNVDGFAVLLDAEGRHAGTLRVGEEGMEQLTAGALGNTGETYVAGIFNDTLPGAGSTSEPTRSQGKTDAFLLRLERPDSAARADARRPPGAP